MKKNLLMTAVIVCALAANLTAQSFSKAFSFGGSNDDKVTAVKIDGNGNMYFAGFFRGTVDFIGQTITSTGGSDGFLLKLDSAGAYQWVSTFDATGVNNVEALAMDIDASGNTYLTGYFGGTMDFNSAGSNTITAANGTDIFVVKFNNLGGVTWAKKAGSTSVDIGKGISVGTNGNVYITGYFNGTVDFDPDGATNVDVTSNGGNDVFVWKLTPGGNISWAIGYGDTGNDQGFDVRVENGMVYTVGTFNGTVDLNPGPVTNNVNSTSPTASDVFIQKLDAQGTYIYGKQIGAPFSEDCYTIEVDQDDNLYVAGSFQGTIDLDPNGGTFNVTSAGGYDGYLLQLDSVGDFQWGRIIGGTGSDEINRIALGEFNNIYAIGDYAGSMDVNTDTGTTQTVNANGGYDIFSIKLTNTGNFISGFAIGGGSSDNGNHIIADAFGNIYLSGNFGGTMDVSPWQTTSGSVLTTNGAFDGFVAKYRAYTVGLNEISTAPAFELFPNPAQQMFYVVPPPDFGNCTIAIYNAQGKLVVPPTQTNGTMQVGIQHHLSAGVYTVKLSGKTSLTKKLVVGL